MKDLIKKHDLLLLQARDKKVIEDTFDDGLGEWKVVEGDFHHVTIDTNIDDKTGMEGKLLIDACGSYLGGVIEREVDLDNYGEIVFERYVKNDGRKKLKNKLNFYIDGALKVSIEGPNPWRRIEPIGISPGKHTLTFEYIVDDSDNPAGTSGVFDSFTIWEARHINALVSSYTPAVPASNISSNKTLRGYTRYQEMSERDTQIKFSVIFNGADFHNFMVNSDKVFYFIDEFGVVYRGIFPNNLEPKSVALQSIYVINLTMIAAQKAGVGFV